MGWGSCGEINGRPIGYLHAARCDHPGCNTKIDRGLAYACAGMHGQQEYGCEGYFCYEHLYTVELPDGSRCISICATCYQELLAAGRVDEDFVIDMKSRIIEEDGRNDTTGNS